MTSIWFASGPLIPARYRLMIVFAALLSLVGCTPGAAIDDSAYKLTTKSGGTTELHVFLGSATRPPVERLATAFQGATGIRVVLHVGGSGQMLAQLRLAPEADVYIPGSSDYMQKAVDNGDVYPETVVRLAYLIPAINVPRGNPASIKTLADLAQPGVRVAIARPDAVCVGLYAVEVLEKNGLAEKVRPNIVVQAESCEKVAQLVSMRLVDAALGWRVFEAWDPAHIETVLLAPEQVPRIGYVPAAIARKTRNRAAAERFLDFLASAESRAEFTRWGYLSTEAEARRLATPDSPVGGQWLLPAGWP